MELKSKYNLIILGSGAAGINAAIQASKLNKKVCIVEKSLSNIGGNWIHWGTMPSKTLRESLEAIQSIRSHMGNLWVDRVIDDLRTDKLFKRAEKVCREEQDLVRRYLKSNNIEIIEGFAVIESEYQVRVLPRKNKPFLIETDFILLATGSKPNRPSNIPFDGWRVIDSDDITQFRNVPKTIVICGAGATGCEYACIFAALGSKVTIVDKNERILNFSDHEVCLELQNSMEAMGIDFYLGSEFKGITFKGPRVFSHFKELILQSDIFYYAAGRQASTQNLGLEKLGIQTTERGAVVVNDFFQTHVPNIYAAGDIIGPPALAATSFQQGRYVSCHAFGVDVEEYIKFYPIGVYTIPEMSMVGKTEEQLRKEKKSYVVGRAYYYEIARGYIRGDSHGLIKILVCSETHRLLGIHIAGADACNLIHIGMTLMVKNAPVQDLVHMVFNHPTLAEGFRIAGFNALNKIFPDGFFTKKP